MKYSSRQLYWPQGMSSAEQGFILNQLNRYNRPTTHMKDFMHPRVPLLPNHFVDILSTALEALDINY